MNTFVRIINGEVYQQYEYPMHSDELKVIMRIVKGTKLSEASGIAPNYISLAMNGRDWRNKKHQLNEVKLNDGLTKIAEELLSTQLTADSAASTLRSFGLKITTFAESYLSGIAVSPSDWIKRHTEPRNAQYNRFTPEELTRLQHAIHEFGDFIATHRFVRDEID